MNELSGTPNFSTEMNGAGGEPAQLATAAPLAPRDIWTLRDLLLFIAFIPFALLASNLGGFVGYVTLRPFMHWRARMDSLPSNTLFLLTVQSVFYLLVLVYLLLLARLLHHQPFWKSMGWSQPRARRMVPFLLGGAVLALVITLAPPLLPDAEGFPLERLFTSRAASYAIGAFAIAVAPLVEELVFRGLLFAIFERAVGLRFAAGATALLFAGLHVPEYWHAWNHILMILVVGVVFSVARARSGSLAPSVLLHIGYNTSMMAGLFLTTQHFRVLNVLSQH